MLDALSKYLPRGKEFINAKDKLSNKAKTFYKGREKIIEGFKNEIFPFRSDDGRFEDNVENDTRGDNGLIDCKNLERLVLLKERRINNKLLREYFRYQDPEGMLEDLNNTRNTEINNIQENLIKSALTDFKNGIKSMSKNEIAYEQPNEIVNIVED